MLDFNPINPAGQKAPAQTIEKPTSVTVFGIFNIILGLKGTFFGLWYFLMIVSIRYTYGHVFVSGPEQGYAILLFITNTIRLGLSIFLIIWGIGLLKTKIWARAGSIFYGWFGIVFFILDMFVNLLAMSNGLVSISREDMADFLRGMGAGAIAGMIYPALLLIFMQTAKVKRAFRECRVSREAI